MPADPMAMIQADLSFDARYQEGSELRIDKDSTKFRKSREMGAVRRTNSNSSIESMDDLDLEAVGKSCLSQTPLLPKLNHHQPPSEFG
jgi:hypothetical protein